MPKNRGDGRRVGWRMGVRARGATRSRGMRGRVLRDARRLRSRRHGSAALRGMGHQVRRG